MPISINLKASGLKTSPNDLDVEPGALHKASNIVIKRDNVIESRRGFKLYGNEFGTSSDRAKQLIAYRDRLLRHYSDKLQFDDGSGNFTDFDGEYEETQAGLRIKSIEANKNLYFTTAKGIYKIAANTSSDFSSASGFITKSGGIKALDFTGRLDFDLGQVDGFLFQDSAVAYRAVWATKDVNNNLILGAPSGRVEVYNPLISLLLSDFNRLLGALDSIASNSLIDDGDYVSTLKVEQSSTAVQLYSNLLALTTKIDEDILLADNDGAPTGAPLELDSGSISTGVCTLTFLTGDPSLYVSSGSKIFLTDFTSGTGTINGQQTVTSVSSTTMSFTTDATGVVTIGVAATIESYDFRNITQPASPSIPTTDQQLVALQTYLENIILALQLEPNGVIDTATKNTYIDILNPTTSANVILTIPIPEEINNKYFLQLYRSAVTSAEGPALISDIVPNDELQLVYEAYPTAAELLAGEMTVYDSTPDLFRGAFLYTNPSTGEGINKSNDAPPFAKDINRFKEYTFYANTQTKHRKNLNLLGVSNMVEDYNNGIIPKITITNGVEENTYTFVLGKEEITDFQAVDASLLESGANPASYVLVNSANNYKEFYIWYKNGPLPTDPAIAGKTGIMVTIDPADLAATVAQKSFDTLSIYNYYFNVTLASDIFTIYNVDFGYTDDSEAGTSGFNVVKVQDGVGEKVSQEVINFTAVADVAGSLASKYFEFNTAFDRDQYYFYYIVGGIGTDPAIPNKVGFPITISTNATAATIAQANKTQINALLSDIITVEASGNTFSLTSVTYGPATNGTAGDTGFSINSIEDGALQVLLYDLDSPAQSVDQTAKSLIRVISKNKTESIYGSYVSGPNDVPGQMFFESREFNNLPFYFIANNNNTGNSFSPSIAPDTEITSISVGSPNTMLITTSTPHGLSNLDSVIITNTNSTPNIDGLWQITLVSPTSFRVNVTITNAGTTGALLNANNTEASDNEVKPNRIYYSKYQQPEAVPILNYIDISAENKAILRIFPLRDSLFIFKEDGLYRLSGEIEPFSIALFDSSCILKAPDTVDVTNNFVYAWTTQGIGATSESQFQIISRDIDDQILKLASANFTNFKTSSWGVGYDSDNSYMVFTTLKTTDIEATICYRYSNLTSTWTTFNKTNTCGVLNPVDDKLYLGAGNINKIEQERKDFSRTDYADWEYETNLEDDKLFGNTIYLSNVTDYESGDVIVQSQFLTVYEFNSLLKKLDIDPGINSSDYYSLLNISSGANLRDAIVALATKLDTDTGIIQNDFAASIASESGTITNITASDPVVLTSASHGLQTGRIVFITNSDSDPLVDGNFEVSVVNSNTFTIDASVISPGTTAQFLTLDDNFEDIRNCYNIIISKLNSDTGVSFTNYTQSTYETFLEAVITAKNKTSKVLTLNNSLNFVTGPLIIYKQINSNFKYAPNSFGNPVTLKQITGATFMFKNKAFTSATVKFYTDLLPEYQEIEFKGQGNGIFGVGTGSFGDGFFGGNSHAAPYRTYIPRQCQRCTFMVIEYQHSVAREKYELYGVTLTGNDTNSTRGYKG